MPTLNRSARSALAGAVLLSSVLAAHLVLMHRAVAQTLKPCSGAAFTTLTPTQACGEVVQCATPPCDQWFKPNTAKGVFLNQCIGSKLATSNCLKSQQFAACGNGGPCLPNVKGGCSAGTGSTKYVLVGYDGGMCYKP